MENFEWDENKREINLKKHGIDFLDAIGIFSDPHRIELQSHQHEEIRYKTIGTMEGIIIILVYTNRETKKRLISARIASKKERDLYSKLR